SNAPACAGLYGLGPWSCSYSDEETIRWMSRLYRHYCIEGRRDMLSGDSYELSYIRNADSAVLSISDWKEPSNPGGKIGQELEGWKSEKGG
ncbi:MAG: hypothetical protein V2A65_03235, partial [Candidatus Omnitrophota bacterium]